VGAEHDDRRPELDDSPEVTQRGWNFIDKIFEGFHGHGYCANDHWVVHPDEAFLIQGDYKGVAHPTAEGHEVYGARIARTLFR
jgi:hypothetical protein